VADGRSLADRDIAATRRSYAFVRGLSVLGWLVLDGVAYGALHRHGHDARDVFYGVAGLSGLMLLGWLAFLGGLRRRDLARHGNPSYDPRSR
jgi:hypothetical protein